MGYPQNVRRNSLPCYFTVEFMEKEPEAAKGKRFPYKKYFEGRVEFAITNIIRNNYLMFYHEMY